MLICLLLGQTKKLASIKNTQKNTLSAWIKKSSSDSSMNENCEAAVNKSITNDEINVSLKEKVLNSSEESNKQDSGKHINIETKTNGLKQKDCLETENEDKKELNDTKNMKNGSVKEDENIKKESVEDHENLIKGSFENMKKETVEDDEESISQVSKKIKKESDNADSVIER